MTMVIDLVNFEQPGAYVSGKRIVRYCLDLRILLLEVQIGLMSHKQLF